MGDARVVLTPLDRRYPRRLRTLAKPPASLIVQGGSLDAERTVAVVGSRRAHDDSVTFATKLARELGQRGVVVVSGGARGVDRGAHDGALAVEGRTWVVAGTDPSRCYPREHAGLFDRIAQGPGAVIWPFERPMPRGGFPARNRILVALADAVVVVQAGLNSGALSAAGWARKLGKPLWVAGVSPWQEGDFDGSRELLAGGALPLSSVHAFLDAVCGREGSAVAFDAGAPPWRGRSGCPCCALWRATSRRRRRGSDAPSPTCGVSGALDARFGERSSRRPSGVLPTPRCR